MPNILMLHEAEQATLLISYNTFTRFGVENGCTVRKQYSSKITKSELEWADTIICVRGESPITYFILHWGRLSGKFLIFLLDDDLANMPVGTFRYPGRKPWLIRCIQECSILLTSNQLISDDYNKFVINHKGVILHTEVSNEDIVKLPKAEGPVRIVYAGSRDHIINFNLYIKPIMPRLFKIYKKNIKFYIIGFEPEIDVGEYNSQIEYIPSMSLEDYKTFMGKNNFSIGLAPLLESSFTARKYFNKYIEYAKYGICGIYSAVMPYLLIVNDGWNGFVVNNSPEDWLDKILYVIEHDEKREAVAISAQENLRNFFNQERIFNNLKTEIPELTESHPSSTAIKKLAVSTIVYKIRHIVFRFRESLYLTKYSFYHFGFKKTLDKVIKKIAFKGIFKKCD